MKTCSKFVLALLCSILALSAASCELFEDEPTTYMARQIIQKTYTFLDDLASDNYAAIYEGGVGTVVSDTSNPPGMAQRRVSMTITEFGLSDSGYGYWYTGEATFTTWSGDGSSPYMELTGTVTYTNKLMTDRTRVFTGTLDITNGPDDNTIDHMEFDLDFQEEVDATGTVYADLATLTFDNDFIPTY